MHNILTLVLLLCTLHLPSTHGKPQPTCREQKAFPYISCGQICAPSTPLVQARCTQLSQFGCRYQPCTTPSTTMQCAPTTRTPCARNEIPVTNITLSPNQPFDFHLAFNISTFPIDVVLLIDRSMSALAALTSIKPQLKQFVTSLRNVARVGVATYGAEASSLDASAGVQVVQQVTHDMEKVTRALDLLNVTNDGPRRLLDALQEIYQNGEQRLALTAYRKMVFVIGNSPGRELACTSYRGYDVRSTLARRYADVGFSGSVIGVSIGMPGLNAQIDPLPCASFRTGEAVGTIQKGQVADVARVSNGEMVGVVTEKGLREAFERVRRNRPNNWFQKEWGRRVTVTANATAREFSYFQRPVPPPLTDGCGERFRVEVVRAWPSSMNVPVEETGVVRLMLKEGVCKEGPLQCEITVKDFLVGYPRSASSAVVDGHVKVVRVCACGKSCES